MSFVLKNLKDAHAEGWPGSEEYDPSDPWFKGRLGVFEQNHHGIKKMITTDGKFKHWDVGRLATLLNAVERRNMKPRIRWAILDKKGKIHNMEIEDVHNSRVVSNMMCIFKTREDARKFRRFHCLHGFKVQKIDIGFFL